MSGMTGEEPDPGDSPRPPPASAVVDHRDAAPAPTPTLPGPPAVGQAGVALMKTQHVDLAALYQLLAPVVPAEAAQLELGSEGLGLVGPAANAWKEPLDQLAQAIDSQQRSIGELVRVSAPNGLWAAYEVGLEGIDRKATAVAALDDVEGGPVVADARGAAGARAVQGPGGRDPLAALRRRRGAAVQGVVLQQPEPQEDRVRQDPARLRVQRDLVGRGAEAAECGQEGPGQAEVLLWQGVSAGPRWRCC